MIGHCCAMGGWGEYVCHVCGCQVRHNHMSEGAMVVGVSFVFQCTERERG